MKLIRLASNRLKRASTRRTLAGAFGLLLALGLTVGLALPALADDAPRPIPHSFSGNVTINGAQAPQGTGVYAEVRGTTVNAYTAVDASGRYGDDPLFFLEAPDNSYLGQPVDLYVAGILAATHPHLEWGGETEIDLAVNAQLYTLTVTADSCCPVEVQGQWTVPAGQTQQFNVASGLDVQVRALADNCCCEFEYWTVDGVAQQSNPITVAMSANHTVVADCTALGPYTLTVTANAFCSVTVGQLGTVAAGQTQVFSQIPCGTEVQLQAVASADCTFTNGWMVDRVAQQGNPITVTMCANHTASASGAGPQGASTYNLTVTSASCCPVSIPGVGVVAAGATQTFAVAADTQVQLTPTCTACCTFNGWTVNGAAQQGIPLGLTMNADYTVVANCTALGPFSLTVTSDNCCTVTVIGLGTVQPGQTQVFSQIPCGTQIQITMSGTECCQFCNWTLDGVQSTDNPLNVVMNCNHTVLAHCTTAGPFTLTAVASPATGGTVTGGGSYACGTDVTVQAIASPGWTFTGWSGAASGNATTATVHINGAKTVTASFAPPGSIMDIPLPAGWSTFSVPIALNPIVDTWSEMIATSALNVELIYAFDPVYGYWVSVNPLNPLKPLDGFFVKMATAGTARIIPDTELTPPPSKLLPAGANLVGLASLVDLPVSTALMSAYNAPGNLTGYAQALNPSFNTPNDWDNNMYVRDDPDSPTMKVGKAYWVVMVNQGKLYGFTTTPMP